MSCIVDSHYSELQGRGLGEMSGKKKIIEVFLCPEMYFLLSLRTMKTLLLKGMSNDLSPNIYVTEKACRKLSIGFSLLFGEVSKGMVSVTFLVFFPPVDIQSQSFKRLMKI